MTQFQNDISEVLNSKMSDKLKLRLVAILIQKLHDSNKTESAAELTKAKVIVCTNCYQPLKYSNSAWVGQIDERFACKRNNDNYHVARMAIIETEKSR